MRGTPYGTREDASERVEADHRLPTLSQRAVRLGSALGTIAAVRVDRTAREAACLDVAADLGWPAESVWQFAASIRRTVGASAPRRDWLIAAGWLREDRTTEVLPASLPTRRADPHRVRVLLSKLGMASGDSGVLFREESR